MIETKSIAYRTLKRQIDNDIKTGQMDYAYRLHIIDTFDNTRITHDEAEELRLLILPYKPEVL